MQGNGRTDNGAHAEVDIIQTTDEEGQIHVFEKVDELEVDGKEYALLIYRGNDYDAVAQGEASDDDEDEVVVMKISYEDGQEVYEAIEDEEEFEKVVSYIETMEVDEDGVTIEIGDLLSDDEEEKN